MIIITSDFSEIYSEMDRLERLPGIKGKAILDGVLALQFTETQIAVHVETGALKASGQKKSDVDLSTWTGTITYGGITSKTGGVVDYAIYEKARDEQHDFFAALPLFHPLYVAAMKEILSK